MAGRKASQMTRFWIRGYVGMTSYLPSGSKAIFAKTIQEAPRLAIKSRRYEKAVILISTRSEWCSPHTPKYLEGMMTDVSTK
jgi:hypothetical protein